MYRLYSVKMSGERKTELVLEELPEDELEGEDDFFNPEDNWDEEDDEPQEREYCD